MSLQLANNEFVLWREQTSENSDPIDSDLNTDTSGTQDWVGQEIIDLSIEPEGINDTPDRVTWSADSAQAPFIKNMASVDLEIPLTRGVSGSDNQPRYHPIWKAMNFSESIGSGTTTYSPSTPHVSWVTIYQFIRNATDSKSRLRYLTDGHFSGEISLTSGEEASLSASGAAYYKTITTPRDYINDSGDILKDKDGTDLSTFTNVNSINTVADNTPLIPKNMTFTLDSTTIGSTVTYDVSELSIDLNWTQDTLDVFTNPQGDMPNYNTRGAGEGVTGSFSIQDWGSNPATNMDNLISAYESAEEIELSADLVDNGGNTRIKITLREIQLGVESVGENGNLRQYDFDFKANRDLGNSITGDSSIEIEYT